MTLKYTAQVIDGFNLTEAALDDLDKLISNYGQICSMRSDITHMWDVLKRNSENASEKGVEDLTILNPNLSALQEILAGYGDDQYAKAIKDIQDWYEAFRWKYGTSSKSTTSNEDDETEIVEAT
jgi:hypothetical protein